MGAPLHTAAYHRAFTALVHLLVPPRPRPRPGDMRVLAFSCIRSSPPDIIMFLSPYLLERLLHHMAAGGSRSERGGEGRGGEGSSAFWWGEGCRGSLAAAASPHMQG